jgi:hypothetical protein
VSAAGHYRPDQLNASQFWGAELEGKRTRVSRGWIKTQCPFHRGKSGLSFAANVENGSWVCWGGCGKGDLISFVRKRYGLSFVDACRYLKAWDGDSSFQPQPKAAVPFLTLDFAIEGEQYSVSVRDEPKYEARIRRFYCDARERLTELLRGNPEEYPGETESCWESCAIFHDEIRELENL